MQQRQHAALLGEARHVQIGVGIAAQAVEAAEQVLGIEPLGIDLVFGGLEGFGRRRGERWCARRLEPRQDAPLAVDQVDGRKGVIEGQRLEDLLTEPDRRGLQVRRDIVQIAGHGLHMGGEVGLLVLSVGLGHLGRILDHSLDPMAEPVVDGPVDQGAVHQGDDDRRHHRHEREQDHEAEVQARPGVARTLQHGLEKSTAG